jgi:hypothetical protein
METKLGNKFHNKFNNSIFNNKKLKRSLNCKSITLIEMEWLLSTKNKSYKKKLLNSGILTKNKKPSNSSNSYKTHHK